MPCSPGKLAGSLGVDDRAQKQHASRHQLKLLQSTYHSWGSPDLSSVLVWDMVVVGFVTEIDRIGRRLFRSGLDLELCAGLVGLLVLQISKVEKVGKKKERSCCRKT